MSNTKTKLSRALAALAIALLAAASAAAQDSDAFKKIEAVDFSKQKVTRDELKDLELLDLSLLRGVVFGRHGRVFKYFCKLAALFLRHELSPRNRLTVG